MAHLLNHSQVYCRAVLGAILKNYDSNLLVSSTSHLTVIEADEYDRSFHWLHPYMAVITSADPDHLDVYGTPEAYKASFDHFTSLIQPGGCLIMKKGIHVTPQLNADVKSYTYSASETADFYATNIRIGHGEIFFDFVAPYVTIQDIQLGIAFKFHW